MLQTVPFDKMIKSLESPFKFRAIASLGSYGNEYELSNKQASL